MLRTPKPPTSTTVQTVFPCSNGRCFATYNLGGKNRFVGTFGSEGAAQLAVHEALKGRTPKKSVCYY